MSKEQRGYDVTIGIAGSGEHTYKNVWGFSRADVLSKVVEYNLYGFKDRWFYVPKSLFNFIKNKHDYAIVKDIETNKTTHYISDGWDYR